MLAPLDNNYPITAEFVTFFQLDNEFMALVLAVVVLAGLVHGALGLGFPMVATPLIAIFLDVRVAILITLLPTAVINLSVIFNGSELGNIFRRFRPMVLSSVVGSVLGTHLVSVVDPHPFRLVLALLIILFLLSRKLGRIPVDLLDKHPIVTMSCFGLLAGLSAGTTNVMVAILIIYFLSIGASTLTTITALNMCFLAGKLTQISVFLGNGLVSVGAMVETIPLSVGALVALLIGRRIQPYISTDLYRKILYVILVILAAVLAAQYFYIL